MVPQADLPILDTVEIVSDSDPSAVNYTPYFVLESTNTVAPTTTNIVSLGAPSSSLKMSTAAVTASPSAFPNTMTNSARTSSATGKGDLLPICACISLANIAHRHHDHPCILVGLQLHLPSRPPGPINLDPLWQRCPRDCDGWHARSCRSRSPGLVREGSMMAKARSRKDDGPIISKVSGYQP